MQTRLRLLPVPIAPHLGVHRVDSERQAVDLQRWVRTMPSWVHDRSDPRTGEPAITRPIKLSPRLASESGRPRVTAAGDLVAVHTTVRGVHSTGQFGCRADRAPVGDGVDASVPRAGRSSGRALGVRDELSALIRIGTHPAAVAD